MTINRALVHASLCTALLVGLTPVSAQTVEPLLTLKTSRVSLSGTSNIHDYTAVSTSARVMRIGLTVDETRGAIDAALAPGGLTAFELAVPVLSLSSPRDGLDKNMHKALRATEHPEIVFRLARLEPAGAAGSFKATGIVTIAGVEREVTLPLTTERAGSTLTVRGQLPLVMTEFKVTPPKAMMGMLRTDPKVTVSFEVVLTVPQA